MSMKYIVPALAVASGALAQSSSCSVSGTTTIQNSGDATALAGCRTFSGSVAIATGATGNIALDGVERISGSLVANNVTQLLSLSSSSLEEIGDSFTLNQLTIMSTLSFPQLVKVDSIDWEALPALQGLSFAQSVQEANFVSIQNTELATLDGLNLEVVDTMILANNRFLTSINMQLGNVSTQMTVESNGRDLSVEFPNMMWANNITVRNASTVSIPSIESVNGSMGFYGCEFERLGFANLTTVGGSLVFINNAQLQNLSLPELETVGGAVNIARNPELDNITFPSLQSVRGALDFYGNFSTVDTPDLNLVLGAFNLQSSENLDDVCSHYHDIAGPDNVIRGKYTCAGARKNPGGSNTLPDGTNDGNGTNTGDSSSATSHGAASPLLIPTAGTFLGVVAAIFGIF